MQHTHRENTCNICLKQWNILNKLWQHTSIGIATCATSGSTFATFIWNAYNIPLIHQKHMKHTFTTRVFCITWRGRHYEVIWHSGGTRHGRGGHGRWMERLWRAKWVNAVRWRQQIRAGGGGQRGQMETVVAVRACGAGRANPRGVGGNEQSVRSEMSGRKDALILSLW